MSSNGGGEASVLDSKRNATIYQILVEIAQRQPAVSQQEIADEIGVTAQAVSDYLQELVDREFVDKQGRGRYEITKEGVDWLISETDALRGFVEHVSEDILDHVDVETAIASTDISEGEGVSLTMQDGVLHAMSGQTGSATAVAITDAEAGQDVGISNFEGVIDYELGTVSIVSIPPIQDGGSAAVGPEQVETLTDEHELLAINAPEGLALARRADVSPDIRFGAAAAVQEAATRGLDVLLLAPSRRLATHTDALREHNVSYEVIDPARER